MLVIYFLRFEFIKLLYVVLVEILLFIRIGYDVSLVEVKYIVDV